MQFTRERSNNPYNGEVRLRLESLWSAGNDEDSLRSRFFVLARLLLFRWIDIHRYIQEEICSKRFSR
jgi:hypothetical protein